MYQQRHIYSERVQNFGYRIDLSTGGVIKFWGIQVIKKNWCFEVLYISQVEISYAHKIKDENVYSSVFDTHVKGGYCWSQIVFDKWVYIHLSHLLSSCQTSSTCWAHV